MLLAETAQFKAGRDADAQMPCATATALLHKHAMAPCKNPQKFANVQQCQTIKALEIGNCICDRPGMNSLRSPLVLPLCFSIFM